MRATTNPVFRRSQGYTPVLFFALFWTLKPGSALRGQSRFATPRYFEKYADVCQPNYMVGAPCICMAEPEAFQDELIGRIRTPYEIHVDLHMAGAGWVRGPLGRQRARPASILNMPPRAPPAGVCAAGGARRSRTSLAGPGGVPIYFTRGPLAATPRDGTWVVFEAGPNRGRLR